MLLPYYQNGADLAFVVAKDWWAWGKKKKKKKETVSLSGEYWAVGWLHEIEE